MWLGATVVYWSSLGLLAYTYMGYPAVIYALSRWRPRKAHRGTLEPRVSLVLAAHNEAQHIARKLENLLELDYPADLLEIIVVSDGSNDATDAIVSQFANRGVLLERLDQPLGKPSALNRGVERASGEIVVFCDARQQVDTGAIRALVAPFADARVGAVSGELHLPRDKGPGLYWAYEKLIRFAESQVDSVVGATGALYAIRRHLFRPLPADCLLDDVFTPMQISLQGYRVLFEPEAKVFDEEASQTGEFARKARTLAGNYQLIQQLPILLDPRKNRLWPQLVSHKLLRLACPFALGGLLASNIVLVSTAAPGWPFYCTTLLAQLAAYGSAARGALAGERAGRLARTSYTFVNLNLAAIEGLRRFARGELGWTTGR
jgi:biofilm PGA synthesis N-glycosyltransferase PgaC